MIANMPSFAAQGKEPRTPLDLAIGHSPEIAAMLIEHGARLLSSPPSRSERGRGGGSASSQDPGPQPPRKRKRTPPTQHKRHRRDNTQGYTWYPEGWYQKRW